MRKLALGLIGFVGCCGVVLLHSATAAADEPRSSGEPRIMMEPGDVTNVIDAFDDMDAFDLNVSLGFNFAARSARILRETTIPEPGLTTGGFTTKYMNVAQYSSQIARLTPKLEIGLFRDLALFARFPIVLTYSQKLEGLEGSENQQGVVLQGAPGEQLFSLPFKSPDRSGLEYIAVGFDWGIWNQARDRSKPTWVFSFEARFNVGDTMQACNPDSPDGQVECADPADINRNGQTDNDLEGNNLAARQPGVTRGTIGLAAQTLMSRRVKYIEPYGGFHALAELYNSRDFALTDLEGSLVNHPPFRGGLTVGMMIIPWENREKFGRLTLDMRFTGTYVSEGRDFSELFDALGSSNAASLRNPQWAEFRNNPDFSESACNDGDPATPCVPRSVVNGGSQRTYMTGLTDVQAHGEYRASGSVTWQASEYVKFNVGAGFQFDQGHLISQDQPCNPSLKDDVGRAGPCHAGNDSNQDIVATGVPNPNYRPTINNVGRRFFVDGRTTWDLSLNATVMF